jgi:tetratricopeptide (TPR) repeat protein
MKLASFIFFMIVFLSFNCSKKNAEVILSNNQNYSNASTSTTTPNTTSSQVSTTPYSEINKQSTTSGATPCKTLFELEGKEKETAETAFALYKDLFKIQKYSEALPYWRQAFTLAPGSNGKIKSHFDDGVNIYAYLLKQSKDNVAKSKYADTIKMIHAKREECFGSDGSYVGQKAYDYYYHMKELESEEEIYKMFKKSTDMNNGKMDYFIINPFVKLISDRVANGKETLVEGSKYATYAYQSIQFGLKNCTTKTCESWKIVEDYASNLLTDMEATDKFYSCQYYKEKYYTLFKEFPDSCEVINLAYSRMIRGGCSKQDEGLMQIQEAKNKCTETVSSNNLIQAYNAYQNGQYSESVRLYEKQINESSNIEMKAKYLMIIASIYYRDLRNFSKARQYAYDAAKIKPNYGQPYILIGKLYASSGSLCGQGRGWDSQVITWAALDKWEYAKSIDVSSAKEANDLIAQYKKYMPSKEEVFQRNLKEGQSYIVPCWIKETTKIRTL